MTQPPYPPNASWPGYPAPGYPMGPPTRLSGLAVTSLVCGVLLCVPLLTGLLAIVFGAVGIGVTRNPAMRGRGLAVAGLILGIVNLAAWGGGGFSWWQVTIPERELARHFVNDVSRGNSAAIFAESTPDVTAAKLQAIDWFAKGTVQSVNITGTNIQTVNGFVTGSVNCDIHLSDGKTESASFDLIKTMGSWKVHRFQIQ